MTAPKLIPVTPSPDRDTPPPLDLRKWFQYARIPDGACDMSAWRVFKILRDWGRK